VPPEATGGLVYLDETTDSAGTPAPSHAPLRDQAPPATRRDLAEIDDGEALLDRRGAVVQIAGAPNAVGSRATATGSSCTRSRPDRGDSDALGGAGFAPTGRGTRIRLDDSPGRAGRERGELPAGSNLVARLVVSHRATWDAGAEPDWNLRSAGC
jgi:hypothetical protein